MSKQAGGDASDQNLDSVQEKPELKGGPIRAHECFLLDAHGVLVGPISIDQAHEQIALGPDTLILIRSCQPPVRTGDRQGVNLVLAASPADCRATPVPPRHRPEIFTPAFEFSCVATQHFDGQRRWFRQRQGRRRAVDVGRMEARRFPHAVRLRKGLGPPQARLKALVLRAGSLLVLGVLVFSPQMFLDESPPDYWSLAPGDGHSLRARASVGLDILVRAVEAKLTGDASGFSDQLLKILPHHGLFSDNVLPAPVVVASLALASLEPSQLDLKPTWRPLLSLLTGAQAQGLAGLAYFSQEGSRLLDRTVTHAQRSSRMEQRIGADQPQSLYWGVPSADTLAPRLLTDVELRFQKILSRVDRASRVASPHESLRQYFLARILWVSQTFYAGSRGRLGASVSTRSKINRMAQQLAFPDQEILRFVLAESDAGQQSSLAALLKRRMAFLRRLHKEGDFLCEPGRSVLGIEFLLQTVRLGISSGGLLQQLQEVFANCLVRPSRLLPTVRDRSLGEPELLLAFRPAPLDGYSIELQAALGDASEQSGWLMEALQERYSNGRAEAGRARSAFMKDPTHQWLLYLSLVSGARSLVQQMVRMYGPGCAVRAEGLGDPFCWRLRWESLGLDPSSNVALRLYLEESARRYALSDVQELYFQRVLQHYVQAPSHGKNGGAHRSVPMDPVLFARSEGAERFLDLNRPHLNALEWYARRVLP
jgi:hypothetical protein